MEELLKQILTLVEQKISKKRVIIIETSSNLYCKNMAEVLKKHEDKLELLVWKSTEYGNSVGYAWENTEVILTQEDLLTKIKDTSLVLIPCLSRDLLAKGALCMSDTSSSYALQVALMQKKAIMALDSEINVASDQVRLQGFDANENYHQMLDIYRDKLIHFGVAFLSIFDFSRIFEHWIKEHDLSSSNDAHQPMILTYQDVVGKKEVTMNSNMKMTEMAKDYIRDNGVAVKSN